MYVCIIANNIMNHILSCKVNTHSLNVASILTLLKEVNIEQYLNQIKEWMTISILKIH